MKPSGSHTASPSTLEKHHVSPPCSIPYSFLRSSGHFLPWQPLGRFAFSPSLPSSLWDVCLTVFILANAICPQDFDVCVRYLIALTVPQLFRSKQAPRLFPFFPFFPRCLIVLSYLGGSLFVSSLPRYQRLEAYLLRIALKNIKRKISVSCKRGGLK